MKKVPLNTWSPTAFISAGSKSTFAVGALVTDHIEDLGQEVKMRFVGLQFLLGTFAVNIGLEKWIKQ